MKIIYLIIVLSCLLGCIFASDPAQTRISKLRPVLIQIIDAETDKPLEGIQVLYTLEVDLVSGRFFKLPEPKKPTKNLIRLLGYTDREGVVIFDVGNRCSGQVFLVTV